MKNSNDTIRNRTRDLPTKSWKELCEKVFGITVFKQYLNYKKICAEQTKVHAS